MAEELSNLGTENKETNQAANCESAVKGRLSKKIFIPILAFTLVVLITSGWYGWQLHTQIETDENQQDRIIELNGTIIHLDEVLTMSARMAAATGDSMWEHRYRSFEPQLDAVIKEAMALAPEDFMNKAVTQTDKANIKLVEIENEAFRLVRSGNREAATALLYSQEYKNQKRIYSSGMKQYVAALEGQIKARFKGRRNIVLGIIAFVGLILVLAVFSCSRVVQLRAHLADRELSEGRIKAANQQLRANEQQLKAANQQLEAKKQQQEILLHDMGERMKEQRCMYGVADSIQKRETLEEVFQDVVMLIPPGWHYPEITRAKIYYADTEYFSEPFEETQWKQTSDLVVSGKRYGSVEVYYLEESAELDEGPFLKEERDLINGIAYTLSEAIERKQAEQATTQAYKKLEKANQELKEVQSQMVQSEKLASIGQLAAGVAHEMNTPVGFVASNFQTLESYMEKIKKLLGMYNELTTNIETLGKAELLDKAGIIEQSRGDMKIDFVLEDIQDLFDDSKEGLETVTDIIQNLRDFSRIDKLGSLDEYNLNEGIKATLVVAQNEIKYDAEIKTEFSEVPNVLCHSDQINQVLLNILVNAVQAIKSQERESKGTIIIKTSATDSDVACEISDNGPGIDPDTQSKIFDPFFTTRPAGSGTGLGLAISYDIIVHKHDGKLFVDSTIGKGTKFTIKLPIKKENQNNRKEIINNGKENSIICG